MNASCSSCLHEQHRLPYQVRLNLVSLHIWLDVEFLNFACKPWHHRVTHHATSDKANQGVLFFSYKAVDHQVVCILPEIGEDELCRCFWQRCARFCTHM